MKRDIVRDMSRTRDEGNSGITVRNGKRWRKCGRVGSGKSGRKRKRMERWIHRRRSRRRG